MHFSSSELAPGTAYKLLVSTVLPRPIAFVTTVNRSGQVNAAPFSFFNAMGSEPPVVVLGFEPRTDGSQKDTPNNILATREFVVNMVNEPLAAQMNMCAASFAPDVDEAAVAQLATTASTGVAPPRLCASPVSLECKLIQDTPLAGGGIIILGEVLHFHVSDLVIAQTDPLRIDIDKLALISRLSGPLYGRTTDQFEIQRPK
jgi:flavin reductase (DIM6/NTAB) family NADH-FMN oxidoreductase RutF